MTMKGWIFFFFIILGFEKHSVYRIEPGDVLEIIILGEEELSKTVMVMRNGTISLPFVGELKITGLTLKQAEELIAKKLKKYFAHPFVSVILKSPTLPYVSVYGAVYRPGAIEYQRGLKLTDYIALAGGPLPEANLKKVKVTLFKEGTASSFEINVEEIIKEGKYNKNIVLKPGDLIYVPQKFRINWRFVVSTLTLVISALNLYITIQK